MIIIKEKNQKIQILRALAIIAVVMIHTCPPGKWQILIRPFINFAVATFLFLSGYLTNMETSNWKFFYKKRITRVLIPYIVWTFLYTTANFIRHDVDFKKYIINLLTTKSASPLYYIFIYIQFVILTPLLVKLAKSKYRFWGFIISPLSIIIKYYWLLNGIKPNIYISTIFGLCCLEWFLYYYLGFLLGNKIINKHFNITKLLLLYTFCIILQIFETYCWFLLGEDNCGTQIKLSCYLTNSIFILISYWYINNPNINYTNKILLLIGDYSFGIYISHIMVILLLSKLPFWSQIPFCLNSIIVLFFTLLCTLIGKKICGQKLSKLLGLY